MISPRYISAFVVAFFSLAAWGAQIPPSAGAEQAATRTTAQLAELESSLRVASKALREAVGDEAQQAAKAQLLSMISKYFDTDQANRRRQLAEIEARLEKLKAELDRRQATKSEIIHLQLKAMEKDDAGLGLYSRDEMSRLLANYFDADMKNRQGGLVDMLERVKRLHAQLDKRQAARDEILQLQFNVLVNEAAGLGFYSPPLSGI
jgi:hypothetical protein